MTLQDDTFLHIMQLSIIIITICMVVNYLRLKIYSHLTIAIVCQCISYANTALKLVLMLLLIYHAYTIKYDS